MTVYIPRHPEATSRFQHRGHSLRTYSESPHKEPATTIIPPSDESTAYSRRWGRASTEAARKPDEEAMQRVGQRPVFAPASGFTGDSATDRHAFLRGGGFAALRHPPACQRTRIIQDPVLALSRLGLLIRPIVLSVHHPYPPSAYTRSNTRQAPTHQTKTPARFRGLASQGNCGSRPSVPSKPPPRRKRKKDKTLSAPSGTLQTAPLWVLVPYHCP